MWRTVNCTKLTFISPMKEKQSKHCFHRSVYSVSEAFPFQINMTQFVLLINHNIDFSKIQPNYLDRGDAFIFFAVRWFTGQKISSFRQLYIFTWGFKGHVHWLITMSCAVYRWHNVGWFFLVSLFLQRYIDLLSWMALVSHCTFYRVKKS